MRTIRAAVAYADGKISLTRGITQRVSQQVTKDAIGTLKQPLRNPTLTALQAAARLKAAVDTHGAAVAELASVQKAIALLDRQQVEDAEGSPLLREIEHAVTISDELRKAIPDSADASLSDIRSDLEEVAETLSNDIATGVVRLNKADQATRRVIGSCFAAEGVDVGRLMQGGLHKMVPAGWDLDPDGTPAFGVATMDPYETDEKRICANVICAMARKHLDADAASVKAARKAKKQADEAQLRREIREITQ